MKLSQVRQKLKIPPHEDGDNSNESTFQFFFFNFDVPNLRNKKSFLFRLHKKYETKVISKIFHENLCF